MTLFSSMSVAVYNVNSMTSSQISHLAHEIIMVNVASFSDSHVIYHNARQVPIYLSIAYKMGQMMLLSKGYDQESNSG